MTDVTVKNNSHTIVTSTGPSIHCTESNVSVGTPHPTVVVTQQPQLVTLQSEVTRLISEGFQGPKGDKGDSAETTAYTVRTDDRSDGTIYIGSADVGASESAAVWQIKRLVEESIDGDIAITFANGSDEYNAVWDDRLSLTYL